MKLTIFHRAIEVKEFVDRSTKMSASARTKSSRLMVSGLSSVNSPLSRKSIGVQSFCDQPHTSNTSYSETLVCLGFRSMIKVPPQ